MPLTFSESDFVDTKPQPLTFSESDFSDSTPLFQISPLNSQGSFQPSQFGSGLPPSVPPSQNPDFDFTSAISKDPKGFLKSLPQDVQTIIGDIAAGAGNIPAEAYRSVPDKYRPYIKPLLQALTSKNYEAAANPEKPFGAPEGDKPLPFKQGQPTIQLSQNPDNAFAKFIEGFSTPEMLATFPFAASKPVQALFLTQTVPGAVEAASKLVSKDIPTEERQQAATDLLLNGLFSYGLARGLIKKPSTTGVPDALQEQIANAEVLRNQQPQVGLPQVGERNVSQLQQPPTEAAPKTPKAAPVETPVATPSKGKAARLIELKAIENPTPEQITERDALQAESDSVKEKMKAEFEKLKAQSSPATETPPQPEYAAKQVGGLKYDGVYKAGSGNYWSFTVTDKGLETSFIVPEGSTPEAVAAKKQKILAPFLEAAAENKATEAPSPETAKTPAVEEPWQMTRKAWDKNIYDTEGGSQTHPRDIKSVEIRNAAHRQYVERALSEGKPVPPEVLKDYPDLKSPVSASAKPDIQAARKKVAEEWRRNANAIHSEDAYASHVTKSQKDKILADSLKYADEIESGKHDGNFTIGQRIHYEMTGESVPFLPPHEQVTKSGVRSSDWRKSFDESKDIETKIDWLRAVANNRGRKSTPEELADVLSRAEQLLKQQKHSRIANTFYDVAHNPASDAATKSKAMALYEDFWKPESEPVIESVTPLDKQSGSPIEQPVQKFRVGRSPQLYSVVNKLEQTASEKENGEQAVTVRNEKTGEEHVVMETDLKPVTERTSEQKSASRKISVPQQLKSLGYTDSQIAAMPKSGAKALAERGEMVGMGAAVPSEFKDSSRDIYGIAERVRQRREAAEMTEPTKPGKGIAPEASVKRGRQLLKEGVNPEKVMSDFEKSNRVSSDDFSVVRAHGELLARITNKTEENFGTNSPEFRAAYKTESDWSARTKAMQTEWAKSGHAQQGEVDIDTGTFSGLKRAYRESHEGKELPKSDEAQAKKFADQSRKAFNEGAELLKKVGDKIETEIKSDKPEKIPTVQNTVAALADYKGGKMTTHQVKALWQYTKKNYIDKGNSDFSDIVHKVSVDLGLNFKDVANGLAQPKGVRKLTNELWRKQTDARRVSESAKRWVRSKNSPLLGQIVPRIARLMFGAKVFGHGGVAFGTHAPMVAFMPKYSKIYFRDYGRMYKMVFSQAEYEMNVQALRADKNFTTAQRAGLVNDPYKVEDFNNPDMAQYFGRLSGAGNRGYFALKILRQDMFNRGWDKLPETIKTPEMAKAMADDINHITGVVKAGSGNTASLFLFAPKLLMSRAAFLVGDPYKAAEIMSTAMTPARWKALPEHEKFIVLNQIKQKTTILATAYALLLANKYLLQAMGSKQQVNLTDPTKSDFMKFKVAGMDFSYGNATLNMARLPVRLWTIGAGDGGKLKHVIYPDESMYSAAGEFLRSQASPITSFATDIIFKGDYQNRPLPHIPGYGKPIPLPKRLAAQGIKPYTWPEFFAEQALPIPLEEAAREVWRHGVGTSPDELKALAKAAGTTIIMAGTGGRLTEDTQPRKK